MATQKDRDIRHIYAVGRELGMVCKDLGHGDALHILVESVAGCSSIAELTDAQRAEVLRELQTRRNAAGVTARKPARPKAAQRPGKATPGQIGKLWWQIYELQKYDTAPGAPVNLRLRGVIEKELKIDAPLSDPCAWLTCGQANALINKLNAYLKNAKKKSACGPGGKAGDGS